MFLFLGYTGMAHLGWRATGRVGLAGWHGGLKWILCCCSWNMLDINFDEVKDWHTHTPSLMQHWAPSFDWNWHRWSCSKDSLQDLRLKTFSILSWPGPDTKKPKSASKNVRLHPPKNFHSDASVSVPLYQLPLQETSAKAKQQQDNISHWFS